MLRDFKAFMARGNVLDLAVAVIIGVAFGAVVTSMVNDIVMPPIGLILGGVDFKDLFVSLNGQSYPTLGRRQNGRGSGDRLRPVSEHGHQLPDHRAGDLPHRSSREQVSEGVCRHNQGLRLLCYFHSATGEPMS